MASPSPGARRVELEGEELWLLPERAAWWPARRALLCSDLHLGRPPGDAPEPGAATMAAASDLGRLGELTVDLGAERLWILGDLRHATAPHLALADEILAAWLGARADLEVLLVRGNQDVAAGDPDPTLCLAIVDAPHAAPPLTLHHYPPEADEPAGASGWVAGHLHPAATAGGPRDAPRAHAFLLEGRGLVLPAFGAGTRAHPARPRADQRLLAVREGRVEPPVDLARRRPDGRSNPR